MYTGVECVVFAESVVCVVFVVYNVVPVEYAVHYFH